MRCECLEGRNAPRPVTLSLSPGNIDRLDKSYRPAKPATFHGNYFCRGKSKWPGAGRSMPRRSVFEMAWKNRCDSLRTLESHLRNRLASSGPFMRSLSSGHHRRCNLIHRLSFRSFLTLILGNYNPSGERHFPIYRIRSRGLVCESFDRDKLRYIIKSYVRSAERF